MKRLLSLLILFSIISVQAATNSNGDAWYQIVKLSTPTIVIGGKTLKTGDKFHSSSKIKWVKPDHSMLVKNLKTLEIQRFSKTVLAQKGNVTSISDFFIRINMASTRGVESDISLQRSPVAGKFPERRIALVLGNSIYNYIPTLWNAQRDAEDITSTLLDLGFDVIHTYECNYSDMSTAVNRFATLAKDYQVAFFYYAGHGIQEDDINYLIPVDNMLERRDDLRYCLSCNDIVDRVENSGCPSKIFFFDACRNRKSAWSRSALNGLSSMEGSVGTVIAFATQSGKVATDGERGDNSPFAKMLMKNMRTPNISFSEMMTSVVRDTYFTTNKKQYPVQVGNLIETFRFNPITITQNESVKQNSEKTTQEVTGATNNTTNMETLLRKAYNGDAETQYRLGKMYHFGEGVNENYTEAVKWYRKAAEQRHAAAQYELGEMYYYGHNVTKNYVEAVIWYRKAAEQGHAAAQYELGEIYYYGKGVPIIFKEALNWFRKAAEQGDARAQYNLGYMYKNGEGVTKNYREAVNWFRKAAEQGNASAQGNLGYMYSNGYGVTKNYKEAVNWWRKAAEQGDARSQCNIGAMYSRGEGVTKNYKEALNWFRKSAEQGDALAQFNIGLMYEYGYGVTKNYKEAVNWYRKAAEQGEALAQFNIGLMYYSGKGVAKSYREAKRWLKKAADQRLEGAKKFLAEHKL